MAEGEFEIDVDAFLTTYNQTEEQDEAEIQTDTLTEPQTEPQPDPEPATSAYQNTNKMSTNTKNNANSLTEIQNLNVIPPSLFRWNLAAALFQFGQSAALFYFSYQAETKWYLYTNFPLGFDDREGNEGTFGIPGPEQIVGYSITWYSAVFILLSGIDHLATIFPLLSGTYRYYIARSQNPFRWIEYALSASLMRIMIAQLSGVTDIHILFSVFMLAATTMLFGWAHESLNAKARADGFKQNWFPFLAAWLPHMASWGIIFCYFFVSVSRGSPPAFVWAIIIALFILDATFAVLFFLQWAKIGRFRNYVTGEIGFIVLSFTSKTLLAWLNYGGGSR